MVAGVSFSEKVKMNFFRPEVYVYPTPRAYKKIGEFSLGTAEFTDEIGIYIHFPFCRRICAYCGYLKTVDKSGELREKYLRALLREIGLYEEVLAGKKVRTVHFGGGTPSLMSADEIADILGALLKLNPDIANAEEISIEATPESIEVKKFFHLRELGFNRVSLGIQSMNKKEVLLCNRTNISEMSEEAVKTLKMIGFPNVVADLMIGIEGQTVESFERSARSLIELSPETVELYALGLMPNTKITSERKALMDKRDIYRCYDIGRKLFLSAGYRQACHNRYEIPNKGSFFQEDDVFRGLSLIGFGAGARTYADNVHYRNVFFPREHRRSILEYIDRITAGKLAVGECLFLCEEEKIRQFAIYNIEELDQGEFRRRFGIEFTDKFRELCGELLRIGLAVDDGNYFKLTERGLNFRDLIAEEMFSDAVRKVEEAYRPK